MWIGLKNRQHNLEHNHRISIEKVLELTEKEIFIIRDNMKKIKFITCVKIAFKNYIKENKYENER